MNEALKVFLIALGAAISLPLLVVAVASYGPTGFALMGFLFVAVCFLVIYSDLFGDESEPAEITDDAEPGDAEEST